MAPVLTLAALPFTERAAWDLLGLDPHRREVNEDHDTADYRSRRTDLRRSREMRAFGFAWMRGFALGAFAPRGAVIGLVNRLGFAVFFCRAFRRRADSFFGLSADF